MAHEVIDAVQPSSNRSEYGSPRHRVIPARSCAATGCSKKSSALFATALVGDRLRDAVTLIGVRAYQMAFAQHITNAPGARHRSADHPRRL
jgi:hypothetical protein